jgi:hypothetical protein
MAFSPAALAQTQDDASRQIVLDRFNKARPTTLDSAAGKRPRPGNPAMRRPVYRRTGALTKGGRRSTEELGITIWRLRPSRATDGSARVLVQEGLKSTEWTPERIEADTPLNIGDRVRLSVESPRPGYLYIIDREQYADGSLGEPMLIFPTSRTRGGDNRVYPGRLIDIPAQEDQYSYFTAQPGGDRRDQVAEILTFILTPDPLPVEISELPLKLANTQVVGWEKLWGGVAERLELVDGAGRAWTNEEKAAGSSRGVRLDQTGPPPQTVYRVARQAGGPILVTVPLRYAR